MTSRRSTCGFAEDAARAEAKRCLECGCHDYGDCQPHQVAPTELAIDPQRLDGRASSLPIPSSAWSIIERNQGKCILCNHCVRACDEVVGKGLLGLVGRGFNTVIKPEFQSEETIEDLCVLPQVRRELPNRRAEDPRLGDQKT